MSESTAFKRIGAARTARQFPILFAMVERGEIHLSAIHRLKAHLNPENRERVLAAAKHKTIREVEVLVAHLAPQPDVPTTLRALPNRTPAPSTFAATATVTAMPAAPTVPVPAESPPAPPPPRRDADPTPLSPGRYRLQLTISQSACDKLKELRDLMAHQIPTGDPAAIFERALDALLKQVRQQKTGFTEKPRAPKPRATSRAEPRASGRRTRIQAAVRREVWPRDEGRCGFVSDDGHRCSETRGLEFAHIHPWAKGGADTAANLGLRCIAHNALEADRDYGAGFMATKRKQKPLKVREPLARYVQRGARCEPALLLPAPMRNTVKRSATSTTSFAFLENARIQHLDDRQVHRWCTSPLVSELGTREEDLRLCTGTRGSPVAGVSVSRFESAEFAARSRILSTPWRMVSLGSPSERVFWVSRKMKDWRCAQLAAGGSQATRLVRSPSSRAANAIDDSNDDYYVAHSIHSCDSTLVIPLL